MASRSPLDGRGPTPAVGVRAMGASSPQQGRAAVGRPVPWGMPHVTHRLLVDHARARGAAPPRWRPCGVCLANRACGCHARGVRHWDSPRPNAFAHRGVGIEQTAAPRAGALGALAGAQIADGGRATQVERPGHGPLREALGVECAARLGARKAARPPYLAGDLGHGRAAKSARVTGQLRCGSTLAHGRQSRQPTRASIQESCEGFPPMAAQMPASEDVLGRRRAQCGAARVLRRALTAADGAARMGPEPGRARVSRAVGDEVGRPMAFQVHQQSARGPPPAHGPIVHPKDGGRRHGRRRQLADEAPQGIRAGQERELGPQPRPGLTAQCKPSLWQRHGQVHGALCRGSYHLEHPVGEGVRGTAGVQAATTADAQAHTHGVLPQRQVARAACIVTMHAPCGEPTARATGRGRGGLGGNREHPVALAHRTYGNTKAYGS
jgi:hypothetical protein